MSLDQKFDLILAFTTGPYKGKRARIQAERVILGRSHVCDIQLSEEGVSRQHGLITYQQHKYFIEDLETENGIFVNNRRIDKPQVLYHKDRVRLGKVEFGVLIPGTLRPKKLSYEAEKLDLPTDLGASPTESGVKGIFKNKRLLIYGGVGMVLVLGVVWMMGGEETPKTPGAGGTEAQAPNEEQATGEKTSVGELQKEIESRQKTLSELMQKEAEQERKKVEGQVLEEKSDNPSEDTKLQLAESHFQSGLKELMAQSYVQAEKDFNLSLALNPKNLLVSEYLMRTRRKRRAIADENYQLGKNYFASLQYDHASSQFRQVINLLEIESQNLDHESKGYLATLENAKSYLDRSQKALAEAQKH